MIRVTVSAGVRLIVALGSLRIVKSFPIQRLLMILYGLMFLAMIFTSNGFVFISFDASVAVTGAISVPFIMAFGSAIASIKKKAQEADSFDLTGLVPVGATMVVMVLSLVTEQSEVSGALDVSSHVPEHILAYFWQVTKEQILEGSLLYFR